MLAETISNDIQIAMRNKDAAKLDALRAIKAAIQRLEVGKTRTLIPVGTSNIGGDINYVNAVSDTEVIKLIETLVKQRKEAVVLFTKADRHDLAEKDTKQIAVMEVYLPQAFPIERIKEIIEEVVTTINTADRGEITKQIMIRLKGQRFDGKEVNKMISERLSK